MARPPGRPNLTKIRRDAEKTRERVKTREVEVFRDWRKVLDKKAKALETHESRLRKALARIERDAKERKAALEDVLGFLEDAHKDLVPMKMVPVKEPFPDLPKSHAEAKVISLAVVGWLAWIVAVRAYGAVAQVVAGNGKPG